MLPKPTDKALCLHSERLKGGSDLARLSAKTGNFSIAWRNLLALVLTMVCFSKEEMSAGMLIIAPIFFCNSSMKKSRISKIT